MAILKGTNGNKLEVWFARVLFLLRLRVGRDVEETGEHLYNTWKSHPIWTRSIDFTLRKCKTGVLLMKIITL